MKKAVKKLLFVCMGNSARSQMAEGLMNAFGSGHWKARSGGVFPSYVHPLAIQVMEEIGIDLSHQTSKSLSQFLNESFDYIITLCDHVAKSCPAFPGKAKRLHWSIEDPAIIIGTMEERVLAFRRARDEIKNRIEAFLKSN
jgi:arsenate reductase